MVWSKLDDRANEHRKMLAAGGEACWFWSCGLMYCNRQPERDGFIPDGALPMLYGPAKRPKALAEKLVSVGLWERIDGGYRVHDFRDWNQTAEQRTEELAKGRERAAASYARRHPKSSPEEHPKKTRSLRPKTPEVFADSSGSDPDPDPDLSDPSDPRYNTPQTPSGSLLSSDPDPDPPVRLGSRGRAKSPKADPVPVLMTEDWQPDAEQVAALAAKHRVSNERILAEVPEFRWYWRSGSGAGKRRSGRGWSQAFGNRIAQEAKRETLYAEGSIPRGARPITRADAVMQRQLDHIRDLEMDAAEAKDLERVLG